MVTILDFRRRMIPYFDQCCYSINLLIALILRTWINRVLSELVGTDLFADFLIRPHISGLCRAMTVPKRLTGLGLSIKVGLKGIFRDFSLSTPWTHLDNPGIPSAIFFPFWIVLVITRVFLEELPKLPKMISSKNGYLPSGNTRGLYRFPRRFVDFLLFELSGVFGFLCGFRGLQKWCNSILWVLTSEDYRHFSGSVQNFILPYFPRLTDIPLFGIEIELGFSLGWFGNDCRHDNQRFVRRIGNSLGFLLRLRVDDVGHDLRGVDHIGIGIRVIRLDNPVRIR